MRCIDKRRPCILLAIVALFAGCVTSTPGSRETAAVTPVAKNAEQPQPTVNKESRRLYDQALVALQGARWAEAERMFLAVVRREPALAGPRANLGIVYAHTNRPAQAIESLRQAIRLNPDRAAYYNELGVVYRREGKFEDAERSYEKALEADRGYAYAHLNLAILYDLYLPHPEKALQHYERYRELTPSEAGTVTKWIVDLQQRQHGKTQARGEKSG